MSRDAGWRHGVKVIHANWTSREDVKAAWCATPDELWKLATDEDRVILAVQALRLDADQVDALQAGMSVVEWRAATERAKERG